MPRRRAVLCFTAQWNGKGRKRLVKQREYEKLPMHAELRAQTLRAIEAYKSFREASADELGPAMIKSISDFIVAYDNNELSPATQRALFRNMRRLVAKYPV